MGPNSQNFSVQKPVKIYGVHCTLNLISGTQIARKTTSWVAQVIWYKLQETHEDYKTQFGCVEAIEACFVITVLNRLKQYNVVRKKGFCLIASTRGHLIIHREGRHLDLMRLCQTTLYFVHVCL